MKLLKLLLALLVLAVMAVLGLLYLSPETAARLAINGERSKAGLVKKEITLPDGLRYVYLEGGTGAPLLLLHGFGADKDNFTRIARQLTPHYRVIAPDHIGFGESAHPEAADYRPAAQAVRLHALMQQLGVGPVHIGGSSMGGHIAMSYAVAYPAEVQSLWLLDPGGAWKTSPKSELTEIIDRTGKNPLMATTPDEFAGVFGFVMAKPPFVPRPILDVMAKKRIANFALEQKIFAQLRGDSIEEQVKGLATPTLIVFGEQDRAIHPGSAAVLHALLPKSEVILMPGIGHLPMIEDPAKSAADYLAFRQKLAP